MPDFGELMQLLVLELIKKICKANPLEKVTEDTAQPHGSLLWLLSRTCTPSGARTLRSWILAPLTEHRPVVQRLAAVTGLSSHAGVPACLVPLVDLIQKRRLPDLERGLAAVHYR